jgi:hypothetical protein
LPPVPVNIATSADFAYCSSMTKLEKIEREIEALPPQEMRALAAWFSELRERLWEREIETGSPEMDALAARALEEHQAGKTTPLVRR